MNDDIEDGDEDEEKELTLFDQIRDALPAGVTTNAVFIQFLQIQFRNNGDFQSIQGQFLTA